MKIYYVNHKNEKIDLSDYPYIFQEGDLLNWEYKYDTEKKHTLNFRKEPQEHKCRIAVVENPFISNEQRKREWIEAINRLSEMLLVDVINNKNGRLYVNDSYMPCKVFKSEKPVWRNGMILCELSVLTDRGYWVTEQKVEIQPISDMSALTEEDKFKIYPYGYPYKYPYLKTEINVNIDHYDKSDFKMTIFGPTESIMINIAGHPYEVKYPIELGEYMVIDSRSYIPEDERIYVVHRNGTKENVFNFRSTEQSVFKKIPPGLIKIDYPRTYGIELIIFKERSEPPWKL